MALQVNTGTTLLYLPTEIVVAYYSQATEAYFYEDQAVFIFPCASPLPDFVFEINSYRGVVPGK
ncbi:hypothetical protein N7462_009123 [Penicillium macrosclerotiorum]|uniref:uncharacterized protein n=1 Tax=Penicillium macrosclerotiorum TaxID=303699 RepID=UPI002548CF46|nr:uncharacterized protein N7462_009123 [Penicillium macrosclerotiorum]KAJ5676226.1 hypothetical protein N7462_009123 [Penicillium macrosclerotiorum]